MIFLVVFCNVASDRNNSIEFNWMSFADGNYSLSYERELTRSLSLIGNINFSNDEYGFWSNMWAPSVNTDYIYDYSIAIGAKTSPIRRIKSIFIASLFELGYAKISLDPSLTPTPDSIYASGFFISPQVNMGYEFIIANRFVIKPSISFKYNFSFIEFSNIGKWEGFSYWPATRDFPFNLTWEKLHNIRNGPEGLIRLDAGILF